jgi:hypothetical protein
LARRWITLTEQFTLEHCPGSSKLAEQNQDQHDNEYEAERRTGLFASHQTASLPGALSGPRAPFRPMRVAIPRAGNDGLRGRRSYHAYLDA